MSGKKAAIILVSIIALAAILVVVAMFVFFSVYEPKESHTNVSTFNEPIMISVEESKNTSLA